MRDDAAHTPGPDLGDALARLDGLDRIREAAGEMPAYLVGGAVRDLLLGGGERSDIDVVVEGEVGPDRRAPRRRDARATSASGPPRSPPAR